MGHRVGRCDDKRRLVAAAQYGQSLDALLHRGRLHRDALVGQSVGLGEELHRGITQPALQLVLKMLGLLRVGGNDKRGQPQLAVESSNDEGLGGAGEHHHPLSASFHVLHEREEARRSADQREEAAQVHTNT